MTMNQGVLSCTRWLEAHSDGTAGVITIPGNVVLADITADGDYRLIISDLQLEGNNRSKLKVYKGILSSDIILPDIPNSIITFYTSQLEPKVPALAVACGSHIYVYKNNKPYYKFQVPLLPVSDAETTFWEMYNGNASEPIDVQKGIETFKSVPLNLLSSRTQELICTPTGKLNDLIKKYNKSEASKETFITCMSTLKKSSHDKYAVSCPVVGTESGHLFILEPQRLTILHQANVCSKEATPCMINTLGLYDVEYRIIVGCRERHICVLRRGWLEGKSIIQLIHNIIDITIIPGEKFLIVATDDNVMSCYTKRGQGLWYTKMKNSVTCLCLVPLHYLSIHLVAVGLKGGLIHLYHGRHMVDYTSVSDTPSILTFGQLGQEENVMVVITLAGTVTLKILKRTADFNLSIKENISLLQSMPLPLPKRSKLFLEQSLREQNTFIDIHQQFHQDFVNLRLRGSRELINNINNHSRIANENNHLRLFVQVLSLEPKCSVIFTLENTHLERPLVELVAIFHTETAAFIMPSSIVKVPTVPPTFSYKIKIFVKEPLNETTSDNRCMSNKISCSTIKVYIVTKHQVQPIIAATVNIPSNLGNINYFTV